MEKAVRAAMNTLPKATPAAKTTLFSSFGPRLARFQASTMLSQK